MADAITLAIGVISIVTMALVLYMLVTNRRKPAANGVDSGGIESTMNEVKGLVSSLQAPVTQLLSTVGAIKQATEDTSTGMVEMRKFADLLTGSSQKRGRAGEIIVRQYFERLPREMWEEQYTIPSTGDRVDFVLHLYNGGTKLLLPIDAKFSLPDGAEDFDKEANILARERSKEVAKYVVSGVTTDFAVMVLPSPVYYALRLETIGGLQDLKVVPCPSEGVSILCMLAMRAQQAVALAQGAEKLRSYVLEIDSKLGRVKGDVEKLGKSLRGAAKWARETLTELDETRGALSGITTRLDQVEVANPVNPQLDSPPPVPVEAVLDDHDAEV